MVTALCLPPARLCVPTPCRAPLGSSRPSALLLLLLLRIISERWKEVEEPQRLHCTCGSRL
jgi:hypothetical protein